MKKLALIGLIAVIIGGVGTFINRDKMLQYENKIKINQAYQYEVDQFSSLHLDVDVGQINIQPNTQDQIDIKLTGYSNTDVDQFLTINEQDDQLSITIDQDHKTWTSFIPMLKNNQLTLNIALPEGVINEIHAQLNVGSLYGKGLTVDQLGVFVDVGDVTFDDLAVTNGEVKTNVGGIELDRVSGNLTLKGDVADLRVALLEWDDTIDMATNVGNIRLTLLDQPDDYSFTLSTELGDVDVENASASEITDSVVGQTYIRHSDGPHIELRSELGDIKLIAR